MTLQKSFINLQLISLYFCFKISGILADASPMIVKLRSTACFVLMSLQYCSNDNPRVNSNILSMASIMSFNKMGVFRSDMNKIFFYEWQVLRFNAFAGYQINL
jgi:hypothetical protein